MGRGIWQNLELKILYGSMLELGISQKFASTQHFRDVPEKREIILILLLSGLTRFPHFSTLKLSQKDLCYECHCE